MSPYCFLITLSYSLWENYYTSKPFIVKIPPFTWDNYCRMAFIALRTRNYFVGNSDFNVTWMTWLCRRTFSWKMQVHRNTYNYFNGNIHVCHAYSSLRAFQACHPRRHKSCHKIDKCLKILFKKNLMLNKWLVKVHSIWFSKIYNLMVIEHFMTIY